MRTCNNLPCRVCEHREGNTVYSVAERMLGTGEEFEYIRCGRCAARSIVEPPVDFVQYYPSGYYSFVLRRRAAWKGRLRGWRDSGHFSDAGAMARLFAILLPDPTGRLPAIARVAPARDARILDVGSGAGDLLDDLACLGFRNLTGIDPFLPDGAERSGVVVTVRRAELADLNGSEFDLVMLHHTLEHRLNHVATLRAAARLLAPQGVCVVRVPLADSWAADHYGAHWVQHDAPRHVVVPTTESIVYAAHSAGLRVRQSWRDSSAFQFWGSEAYLAGESLVESVEKRRRHNGGLGCDSAARHQAKLAKRLNRAERGDQGVFILEQL